MKELSIEEKAKAYDKAIEKAKTLYENANGMILKKWVEQVFPELTESENERIRKAMIDFFKHEREEGMSVLHYGVNIERMIAWLEKQSEQKPADKIEPKFKVGDMISNGTSEVKIVEVNNNSYGVTNDEIENDCNPSNWVVYFKDQDNWKLFEQNPTDKVEPKFKEGDWVIYENRVGIIVRILKEHYIISFDEVEEQVSFTFNDRITKWTIQDAKDGDVLVTDNGLAFIYNGYLEKQQWPFAYGGINIYGRFNICDGLLPFTHQKVVPATKEQRDILFQKMKEVGYEWDAEKKELKKIKQKHIITIPKFKVGDEIKTANEKSLTITKIDDKGYWSEDLFICDFDEECLWELVAQKFAWSEEELDSITAAINNLEYLKNNYVYHQMGLEPAITFLKSLKERVQLQPKQEWNEEDEYYRNIILYCLNNESVGKADKENAIKWFKSLRPQNTWKPSDKQLNNLLDVLSFDNCTLKRRELLESLYNDLKKLREG